MRPITVISIGIGLVIVAAAYSIFVGLRVLLNFVAPL